MQDHVQDHIVFDPLYVYMKCLEEKHVQDHIVFDDMLFRKGKLCIPKCSIRKLLVKEAHGEDLWDILENLKHIACCVNIFID